LICKMQTLGMRQSEAFTDHLMASMSTMSVRSPGIFLLAKT
jgi:hypothetical protein